MTRTDRQGEARNRVGTAGTAIRYHVPNKEIGVAPDGASPFTGGFSTLGRTSKRELYSNGDEAHLSQSVHAESRV